MIGDINNSSDELAVRAFEAMVSGEDILALSLLDQLAAEEPDHPLVGWGRARSLLQQGKEKAALQEARKAVRKHADSQMAWYVLAGVAWQLGNNSMAQDAYEKCIKFSDESELPKIYVEYACFMEDCRSPSIAEIAINKALELAPQSPAAWVALGRLRGRQHRLDEAESCYKRALELDPDCAPAQMSLGYQYKDLGKTTEAQALFKLASDNQHAKPVVEEMEKDEKHRQAWQKLYERKEVQDEVFGEDKNSLNKRFKVLIILMVVIIMPLIILAIVFNMGWSGWLMLGMLIVTSLGVWLMNVRAEQ